MTSRDVNKCWTFVAKNWKDEWFRDCKQEWDKWLENEKKIPDNNKVHCPGCQSLVTRPSICIKENVCHFCDNYCQPMLCNPKWVDLVDHYLPQHKDKLYQK